MKLRQHASDLEEGYVDVDTIVGLGRKSLPAATVNKAETTVVETSCRPKRTYKPTAKQLSFNLEKELNIPPAKKAKSKAVKLAKANSENELVNEIFALVRSLIIVIVNKNSQSIQF